LEAFDSRTALCYVHWPALASILKELEDALLLRFLKEHSLDVEEAAKAIVKHQKWRTSLMPQQPHEYILESEISGELNAKKLYMQGQDKRGHPILVMLGRNHVPNKEDFKEFQSMYKQMDLC
jgi:hypothetical protein